MSKSLFCRQVRLVYDGIYTKIPSLKNLTGAKNKKSKSPEPNPELTLYDNRCWKI